MSVMPAIRAQALGYAGLQLAPDHIRKADPGLDLSQTMVAVWLLGSGTVLIGQCDKAGAPCPGLAGYVRCAAVSSEVSASALADPILRNEIVATPVGRRALFRACGTGRGYPNRCKSNHRRPDARPDRSRTRRQAIRGRLGRMRDSRQSGRERPVAKLRQELRIQGRAHLAARRAARSKRSRTWN